MAKSPKSRKKGKKGKKNPPKSKKVRSIDLRKTSAAYRFLADTSTGHASLSRFRRALDKLQDSIEPGLNHAEFVWVLRGLVAGLNADEATALKDHGLDGVVKSVSEKSPAVLLKSGFVIRANE